MHQTGLLGWLLFINLNPLSQFQTFRLMKHKMLITNDATQNWETVTERISVPRQYDDFKAGI